MQKDCTRPRAQKRRNIKNRRDQKQKAVSPSDWNFQNIKIQTREPTDYKESETLPESPKRKDEGVQTGQIWTWDRSNQRQMRPGGSTTDGNPTDGSSNWAGDLTTNDKYYQRHDRIRHTFDREKLHWVLGYRFITAAMRKDKKVRHLKYFFRNWEAIKKSYGAWF